MIDPIVERSRRMIEKGSSSFAGAARLLPMRIRRDVYMLYAWCRYCDDQVDSQDLGQGAPSESESGPRVLAHLEHMTRRAMAGEAIQDPVFVALQRVVRTHDIPHRHPLELLQGFAMDVDGRRFPTLEDSLEYCYHVAGVVGLMMSMVMGTREREALDRAVDLGIALQMTNIARDVIDDAGCGRVYLPLTWLSEEGIAPEEIDHPRHRAALHRVVRRFLDEADLYYRSAIQGLSWLSPRCAWAIATARGVYREIGRVVLEQGERAWDRRTVVGRPRKVVRSTQAALEAAISVVLRPARRQTAVRDSRLWRRL